MFNIVLIYTKTKLYENIGKKPRFPYLTFINKNKK